MDQSARRDVADRAWQLYEARIQPLVEKEHLGKVLSIDIDSGDYEIASDRNDRWAALERLRKRHDHPQVFSLRIGGGPVARIGGFRRSSEAST